MDLQLSIGMAKNPRTRATFEGEVKPEGVDLICTPRHASELFWRQLRFSDFDVSEMSVSSYMMAVAGGDNRWIGIPVFTTRRMFQFGILVRKDRAGTDNLVDRSTIDLYRHPDFKTLFPDPHAEGVRWYKKTGIYPINHGMIVKREIAEKHPWVVLSIFRAFVRASELAEQARLEAVEYHVETGALPPASRAALATPLIRHGIQANRKVLETAARYSFEQGLTPRLMKLEELFAPSLIDQ